MFIKYCKLIIVIRYLKLIKKTGIKTHKLSNGHQDFQQIMSKS